MLARKACLSVFCVLLCSCASSAKNIPIRQTLYKATYGLLRAAECSSEQENQVAYAPCQRSYFQDYDRYIKLRDEFINETRTPDNG